MSKSNTTPTSGNQGRPRKWTPEKILASARKYQTKGEWVKAEPNAYDAARRDKQIFNQATKHMLDGYQLAAGRERKWSKEAIIASAKKYQTRTEWSNKEQSAYITALKDKQLFAEATKHMVKVHKQWTKEKILESAKKYQTKGEWCLGDPTPYNKALKDKQLFDEATAHMKQLKKPARYWNKERILKTARECRTRSAWKSQYSGAFAAAMLDKDLFEEATAHMRDQRFTPISADGGWTAEKILQTAKECQTKTEWQDKHHMAYRIALKNKQLFYEATKHMLVLKTIWTKEKILESAKKYQTKSEWMREDNGAYNASRKDKQLHQEATKHMTGFTQWNKEKIIEEAQKYNTKTEWARGNGASYRAAIRNKEDPNLFDDATAHMVRSKKSKNK